MKKESAAAINVIIEYHYGYVHTKCVKRERKKKKKERNDIKWLAQLKWLGSTMKKSSVVSSGPSTEGTGHFMIEEALFDKNVRTYFFIDLMIDEEVIEKIVLHPFTF